MKPTLFTFDIFGTVVDWRGGMRAALAAAGTALDDNAFNRVVDRQGRMEQAHPGRRYAAITADSLVQELGVATDTAAQIGAHVGEWPLFDDARDGLRQLLALAPCAAITNSDRAHGAQVQQQLGFPLSHWFCAEDLGVYKPDPAAWHAVAARLGVTPGPGWWHVSAYGDYDLNVARALGLTCVLVQRPHRRAGPADLVVPDLRALAHDAGRHGAPAPR